MDSLECGEKVSKMWLELGEQLVVGAKDAVINNDPISAIHWMTCAEACFWKATGEGSAHDVKDVVPAGFGIKPTSGG